MYDDTKLMYVLYDFKWDIRNEPQVDMNIFRSTLIDRRVMSTSTSHGNYLCRKSVSYNYRHITKKIIGVVSSRLWSELRDSSNYIWARWSRQTLQEVSLQRRDGSYWSRDYGSLVTFSKDVMRSELIFFG